MTQPKPPLARVTERVAETVTDMVNESATAMKDESLKIDENKYELEDAVATVTKLVNVGIAGAAHVGRIAIEEKPPDTVLAMGEYIASVVNRMVSQTGAVAQHASVQMEKKTYTPKSWLESVTRLIDIGIAGGMEIVETVVAGPARFETQPIRSDEFEAPTTPNDEPQILVAGNLKRDATEEAIAHHRISFDPPTLSSSNRKFAVLVNASGLVSGVYEGQVFAEYTNANGDSVKMPVDVSIPL